MDARMAMTVYLNDVPRLVGKGRASRRQLRLPLHGSKATGAEIEALVHNISAPGMLVESGAPLEIGAVIEVHLRSEEHTSELQSLMRNSYAVFCLHNKQQYQQHLHCQSTSNYNNTYSTH